MAVEAVDLVVGDASAERLRSLAISLTSEPWAVFIGAGLSTSAGLLDWAGLMTEMGQRFNVDPTNVIPDNYPFFFEECCNQAPTEADFWAFVESKLCRDVSSSRLQELVMTLPFELFATFNYDCTLDELHNYLPGVGAPKAISYPDFRQTQMSDRRLVYLHGRCNCQESEGDRLQEPKLVLTRSSYQRAYNATTSVLPNVLDALFMSYRVLFVGVGFSEWRMKQILDIVQQREQQQREIRSRDEAPHLAIVSTSESPPPGGSLDMGFEGLSYGVKPIYYFNPTDGGHEALLPLLDWLADIVRSQGSAGAVVEAP